MSRPVRPRHSAESGFTMIEVMVVLVLLALVVGVAVPRWSALYDRLRLSMFRTSVERQLADLPLKARAAGTTLQINESGLTAGAMEIPDGWVLSADRPILFRHDGLCTGGMVTLHAGTLTVTYRLQPPRCRPEVVAP